MKVFKDLVFHKNRTGGINSRMDFDNGFSISVIAGGMAYSTPREDKDSPDDFSSFEVAIFAPDGDFTREFFPDHHDDVFHGMGENSDDEYEMVTKYNIINEGNWGIWLHSQGKLNSFTWIMNDNSDENNGRNNRDKHYLGDAYEYYLKEDYKFENYDFDHVHICLSPQYIHPDHWHYFSMFISAYEEFSGKDAIIYTEKYETHVRHQRLHNEILHQCSDGRRPLPSEGLREWKALRK